MLLLAQIIRGMKTIIRIRIAITIFSLLSVQFCIGQVVKDFEPFWELEYTNPVNISEAYKLQQMMKVNEKTYLLYRHEDRSSFEVHQFESNSIEKVGKIDFPEEDVRLNLAGIGNKLYYLFFQSDKKEKLNCLLAQEFDIEQVEFVGDPFLIDCLSEDDYYRDFRNSFASYLVSPDSTKLGLYYKLNELEDGTKKFRFVVFNQDFELLWKQDVVMRIDEKKLRIGAADWFMAATQHGLVRTVDSSNRSALVIGNDGYIYFWSEHDKRNREHPKNRFEQYISRITSDDVEHLRLRDKNKGSRIKNIEILPTPEGILIKGYATPTEDPDRHYGANYFGAWNDDQWIENIYERDFDYLSSCMRGKMLEKARKAHARKKDLPYDYVGAGDYFSWKNDGTGFYFHDALSVGGILGSYNNNGEQEWTQPLVLSTQFNLYETEKYLYLSTHLTEKGLKPDWAIEDGAFLNPYTPALFRISKSDPSEIYKRKWTTDDKGKIRFDGDRRRIKLSGQKFLIPTKPTRDQIKSGGEKLKRQFVIVTLED